MRALLHHLLPRGLRLLLRPENLERPRKGLRKLSPESRAANLPTLQHLPLLAHLLCALLHLLGPLLHRSLRLWRALRCPHVLLLARLLLLLAGHRGYLQI